MKILMAAIGAVAFACLVIAIAGPLFQPRYEAQTRILVKDLAPLPLERLSGVSSIRAEIERRHRRFVQIAESDAFALDLIVRMSLNTHPEFLPALQRSRWREWLSAAGLAISPGEKGRDELLLSELRRRIHIYLPPNATVLSIDIVVARPGFAAAMARAAADVYIDLVEQSGMPAASARTISHIGVATDNTIRLLSLFALALTAFIVLTAKMRTRRFRGRAEDIVQRRLRVGAALLPERLGDYAAATS